MAAFEIRRRSDNQALGWGNVDTDTDPVTVEGVGLVVTREEFDALTDDPDVVVVWPDGPPGS